uniref:Cell division cycle-associated protein 7-like n=1 Tax=Oryzias melastigma TaxID=30732 RepID=A0A3B3CJH2_ORYME
MTELADIFAEDSDNDATFYGFSDSEITEKDVKHEAQLDISPEEQKASTQPPEAPQRFRLRVALRPPSLSPPSTNEEEEERKPKQKKKTRNKRKVKFEDVEKAAFHQSASEEVGSETPDSDGFLVKREENIKANKAMLAQLMADLQKLPGGPGLVKEQGAKQKRKERIPRALASENCEDVRRNPERASRRQTRSMGLRENLSDLQEENVERSLEEELLEVRRAPRRRGNPRPSQSKAHAVRPVEDITEDELQLVAENMTEKVYNSATGSTCHQCRQKTIDTKTCCRSVDCHGIQGQFCGPCLRNRYGEDVRKALLDPEWKCPPCRGICNCSFCRQREGRCPTGILFPLAQYHGFSDVHSYLSRLSKKPENYGLIKLLVQFN